MGFFVTGCDNPGIRERKAAGAVPEMAVVTPENRPLPGDVPEEGVSGEGGAPFVISGL
jgi:hypothetical protein